MGDSKPKLYGYSTGTDQDGRSTWALVSEDGSLRLRYRSSASRFMVGDARREAARAPEYEFEWVGRNERHTHEGLGRALGESS